MDTGPVQITAILARYRSNWCGCVDMPVTFEPHKRLETLEDYISKIGSFQPLEEIRIQLLRCRLVGYSLVAEINEPAYSRDYIDQIFREVYRNLSEKFGQEIVDPYQDPCTSQYQILDELRSYLSRIWVSILWHSFGPSSKRPLSPHCAS